jgi:hypothetical protein
MQILDGLKHFFQTWQHRARPTKPLYESKTLVNRRALPSSDKADSFALSSHLRPSKLVKFCVESVPLVLHFYSALDSQPRIRIVLNRIKLQLSCDCVESEPRRRFYYLLDCIKKFANLSTSLSLMSKMLSKALFHIRFFCVKITFWKGEKKSAQPFFVLQIHPKKICSSSSSSGFK